MKEWVHGWIIRWIDGWMEVWGLRMNMIDEYM